MNRPKKIKILILIIISLAILSSLYLYINSEKEYKDITYNEFIGYVRDGKVKNVNLNSSSRIRGSFTNGDFFVTDNPKTENFKEMLLLNNVKVIESSGNSLIVQSLTFVLFLVGIGVIAYFVNNGASKQAQKEMTIMSNIDSGNRNGTQFTFDDVAGNEEAKESLKELVDFIDNPEKYSKYGARIPRGVLLYGPPGTGKTLLAKALAGEANVPFFPVSGSDFIQVYAGLGASRIRTLFKKAKECGKSVIFIDEIDALGKKRKGVHSNSGNDEGDRTLNALLTEMSGFSSSEGTIVVAATNRIDTLDEALLRPGRFDRQIEVGLPDVNARKKILKVHSNNKPLSDDVDLEKIAQETSYFSGAMLENLMNEAAMIAAREDDHNIKMKHIDNAFITVLVGDEKKDRSGILMKDKEVTAYHEAGHALLAKKVSNNNRVTKVSIIPSTKGMGGFCMSIPQDKMYKTKKDIIDDIMITLGGRAAEEIIFGKDNITTGAANDLQKATDLTIKMLGAYGMDDELGLVNYEILLGQYIGNNGFIMDRLKKQIEELYEKTKEIIIRNEVYLHQIANGLMKKEVLDEKDIDKLTSEYIFVA